VNKKFPQAYHRLFADGVETVDIDAEQNDSRFIWTINRHNNSNNKSLCSYLHTLTTWQCPRSFAATTLLHAVIDRYFRPAGPTAANLQQRVCCCQPVLDGHTKGQTDGQTSYRFITLAPHTMRVMSITSIPCNDMIIISQHVHVNNSVQ